MIDDYVGMRQDVGTSLELELQLPSKNEIIISQQFLLFFVCDLLQPFCLLLYTSSLYRHYIRINRSV